MKSDDARARRAVPKKNRRSIRLKGYDYTQPGAYFITICTQNRECLFGDVVDGKMVLNDYGEIVRAEWFRTAQIRPYVCLNEYEFVIMPNHVHGIIWIVDDVGDVGNQGVGAQRGCAPTNDAPTNIHGITPKNVRPRSLGAIIRAFKSAATKQINRWRQTPGAPVWQRNYYEHIIRYDRELNRIRKYIMQNPMKWTLDRENANIR